MADPALVEVRIVGMSLAAFRDAQARHDELFREFALIAGDDRGSSVPARLLALIETLNTRFARFSEGPEAELAEALARGDDSIDLCFRVPAEVGPAAAEFETLLAEADEFCRQGDHLLTLSPPPDAVAFRRWYLAAFVDQAAGRPAVSWPDWVAASADRA